MRRKRCASSIQRSDDRPVAVLTLGEGADPAGWNQVAVGQFILYTPPTKLSGTEGAIEAMMAMSEAYGPDVGATWRLAAASTAQASGDHDLACSLMAQVALDGERDFANRLDSFFNQHQPLQALYTSCELG